MHLAKTSDDDKLLGTTCRCGSWGPVASGTPGNDSYLHVLHPLLVDVGWLITMRLQLTTVSGAVPLLVVGGWLLAVRLQPATASRNYLLTEVIFTAMAAAEGYHCRTCLQ